jgi:hypothetical protein
MSRWVGMADARSRWLGAASVCLVALGGCAAPSVYVPTEQVAAEVQGAPASRYVVPPEAPRGDVTVSTHGLATLEPQGGGERRKMFHVGLVLSNDADAAPWKFDGREQKLFVGAAQLTPALVSAGQGGGVAGPVVTVPPGQKRVVDLYFAPPAGYDEKAYGGFDALWTVETAQRRVTERTPFERRQGDPGSSYFGRSTVAVGFGPVWWYDPLYAPFYAFPPVVYYGYGYPYGHGYRGYHGYPYNSGYYSGGRGPGPYIAPPAPGASAPPVSSQPHMSAPMGPGPQPAPSMPSQPHISGPSH